MSVSRKVLLGLAANRLVTHLVSRYGMALGASRFIAGTGLDAALTAVRELNAAGSAATLDYLGESVSDRAEAEQSVKAYLSALDGIAAAGVDSNVSLKLTQMGLDIDAELCLANVARVVERAGRHGNFVRIDMEDSAHLPATMEIFDRLYDRYDNVGLVIQAYLYRAERDVATLTLRGANLRLVKGAYAEQPDVAFARKSDVDANFVRLIQQRLDSGVYTAVATHDPAAIEATLSHAAAAGVDRSRYEFQMLYGIATALQKDLVQRGFKVRVYVPYGSQWYPYFVRRLAERPANLLFFLRSLARN